MKTPFLRGPAVALVIVVAAAGAALFGLRYAHPAGVAGPLVVAGLAAASLFGIYREARRREGLESALSAERERARQNALLGQIVEELRASLDDEPTILEAAVEGLGRAIEASPVVVYRLGPGGAYRACAQFVTTGAEGPGDGATLPPVIVRDADLAQRLAKGDRDSTRDPDLGALARRLRVRSLVTAPIGRSEPMDLVLAVHYLEGGRQPSEEEVRFVQRFAAQLAEVLRQAARHRRLVRAAEVRSDLLRVGHALWTARESRTVVELATSVGAPLVGARASAVFAVANDARNWTVTHDEGLTSRLPERSLETMTSFLERAVRERAPVQVDESALVGRSSPSSWHAVVIVPLFYGREPLGVFVLEHDGASSWCPEEIEDVRVLSELTASALKSAQLFEALFATESRYTDLYDHAPNLYQTVDREGIIEECNLTQSLTLGSTKDELKGKKFENWLSGESWSTWRRLLRDVFDKGLVRDALLELRTREGHRIPVLVDASLHDSEGAPSTARMMLRDVSEVRRLQDQLRQSQKLEVIGALAGGVAHDFNNVLGGILGYASLLRSHLRDAPTALRYVETIERSAIRGAEMTSRMLAVSRRRPARREPIELNSLVEETLELLSHSFHKNVRIETRLDPGLRPLMADAGQLQQIVLNLCVNARDAMPEGGTLRVSTRLDEREDRVRLSVSDTGVGMEPSILERLFEPFFSTKGEEGTGLGLSVVYGIVKSLGGDVRVQSAPGRGATFDISLPCQWCEGTDTDRGRTEPLHGRGELILIVDDEQVLRDLGKDILESHGYRVKAVANGSSAVDFVRASREPISLVILDVVMPGLDGSETYRRLRGVDSRLPVLLSSGLSGEESIQEILADERTDFISKPYGISELTQAVAAALAKGGRPAIVH